MHNLDFNDLDSDALFELFDSPYGNFGLPDIESRDWQFGEDEDKLFGEFIGMKSVEPSLTIKLDENRDQLSTNDGEDKTDTLPDDAGDLPFFGNQSGQILGQNSEARGRVTPYTYDGSGRLEGSEGYAKEVIEHYLCDYNFHGGNCKDCGLTLWIQQAPQNSDHHDGADPAVCLYRDCCVNPNRHIQAGSIRIAFDESTAPGRDPQINAGYVHLKCLEAYIPNLRQIFAKLNFKVEGRGPRESYPWLRNPTIFNTMNAIAYAEEFLEDCRKESRGGNKISDPSLLSVGIEKQFQSRYPVVREVERKILEMEGWDEMKALIDLKYPQACVTAPVASSIESPQQARVGSSKLKAANTPNPEPYSKKKYYSNQEQMSAVRQGKQRAEGQNEYECPLIDQFMPRASTKRSKKPDSSPTRKELEVITELQPLKQGEGKIKWQMSLRNGEEVWEQYEDPWSPFISGLEEDTEDNKPRRRPKKLSQRNKAKPEKRMRTAANEDEYRAKWRRRAGDDDEHSENDRLRAQKRRQAEDEEEYLGNDEPRAQKRKRAGDDEDFGYDEPRVLNRNRLEDDDGNWKRNESFLGNARS